MRSRKFIFITVVLTALATLFFQPERTVAEIVIFRKERSTAANPNFHTCIPMSLTENLSAKINGDTGRGCEFDVEVRPIGEWVAVGGFFDSPPYAWGNDKFYTVKEGNYSFTCNNATYSLDRTNLPSYVQITGETDLPATDASGPGKKYALKILPPANEGSSFNLNMGMNTICTMTKQGGDFEGVLETVDVKAPYKDDCNKATPIEINPRKFTLALPVTIGAACGAPPTEAPTATPEATSTPKPTATPKPVCGGPCLPDVDTCPEDCAVCVPDESGNDVCLVPTPKAYIFQVT